MPTSPLLGEPNYFFKLNILLIWLILLLFWTNKNSKPFRSHVYYTNWVCLIWCPLLHDIYCANLSPQWETRLTGSHEGAYYPGLSKSIYRLIRRCHFFSSCRDTSKDDKRFKIIRGGASPTRKVIGTGKKINWRESAKEPLSLRSD